MPSISSTASPRSAQHSPRTRIEILTPDFRGKGRMERALEILATNPPDVFNHNVETVPDLYTQRAPGRRLPVVADAAAEVQGSSIRSVPTKSGIMLGLGETMEQVQATLRDLRAHDVDMITIGQYLQPSAAPPSGAALLDAGRVQGAGGLRHGAGLQPRRLRPAGALVVPRRPAGDGSRRRRLNACSALASAASERSEMREA